METQFAVFAWKEEPKGGWNDFVGVFDTYDKAIANTSIGEHDWWQIVMLSQTPRIVAQFPE